MVSLINWMYSNIIGSGLWLLKISGLYVKKANLIVIGLDNAGKTTLFGLLVNNQIQCHQPTMYPNKEVISVGGCEFSAYDLGGHLNGRHLWKSYCSNTTCILFMIDSTDIDRMTEARDILFNIIDDCNDIPILILGNKIDNVDACSESKLREYLGIYQYQYNNIEIFMCSVVKRAGISEAFKWLSSRI
jgi:GTP-binding protein SAR1